MSECSNKYFQFPTGEMHCQLDALAEENKEFVHLPYDRSISINDWLIQSVLACHARKSVAKAPGQFALFLPYLPYSRQDRPTNSGEPFSLQVIGRFINQAPVQKVITLDVHSDVAYACVDNLVNIPPEIIWRYFSTDDTRDLVLVIPDQGAHKKLQKLSERFSATAIGIKSRDTKTGHLVLERIVGDVQDRHCLIVDDICDGGRTFTLLAEELYRKGATRVDLAVTHGVFTKGIQILRDGGIGMIATTDSFSQSKGIDIVIPTQTLVARYL